MLSTITKTDQGMALAGKLVFNSVTGLLEQGNQYLAQNLSNNKQGGFFSIDCLEVERMDSAGIALLLEWQRQCSNAKNNCRFVGLSEQAESLINAYRLQSLITA